MGCSLCRNGVPSLRPAQSLALWEAEACHGLFGWLALGGGKELLSLLLPEALNAERAVILTRPRLKTQLLDIDLPRYSKHFRIDKKRIAGVIAYSELSNPRSDQTPLDELKPDLIVANEAHALRHLESMRTRRVKRYLDENPKTLFCALSATMATDDIRDYAHLLKWALRGGSPLPSGWRELQDWALALTPGSDMPLPAGGLVNLMGEDVLDSMLSHNEKVMTAFGQSNAEDILREKAREIFRRRLVSTPGVVVTSSTLDCPAELIIARRKVVVPGVVNEYLETLHNFWRIEDEEFDEAARMQAAARQLACGFYYRWEWPNGIPDEDWLTARRSWAKACRHWVRYGHKLDSPMRVAAAAERLEIICPEWFIWKGFKNRPVPPTVPVWLSDFLIKDIVKWSNERTEKERGIVWFHSRAVEDALREAGLVVYGAGEDEILSADASAICASLAYREGLNVQDRYSRALVIEPPANGAAWEQMLGRLHRTGQKADEVWFEVYQHDKSLVSAWLSALEDARVNHQTHSQDTRLLLAKRIDLDVSSISGLG